MHGLPCTSQFPRPVSYKDAVLCRIEGAFVLLGPVPTFPPQLQSVNAPLCLVLTCLISIMPLGLTAS